jgi:hypothetical protein
MQRGLWGLIERLVDFIQGRRAPAAVPQTEEH